MSKNTYAVVTREVDRSGNYVVLNVEVTDTPTLKKVEWRYRGLLYRYDGPAAMSRNHHGVIDVSWHRGGRLERTSGPAWLTRHPTGVAELSWRCNNDPHRHDGPSDVYPNGVLSWQRYDLEVHRLDGAPTHLPT